MAAKQRGRGKKYFTVDEANTTLPLVRKIIEDITTLAHDLQERQQRLARAVPANRGSMSADYNEEVQQVREQLERDGERLKEYVHELHNLGIELKDYFSGLVDFPCWMDDREVYLCWKLGEPRVAYWHELDAGFAGRQKLVPEMMKTKV